METTEYPAPGNTGLALTVGELREKVTRLKEELARAETNLRDADSRDKSEPPKPTLGEVGRDYDRRVRDFYNRK